LRSILPRLFLPKLFLLSRETHKKYHQSGLLRRLGLLGALLFGFSMLPFPAIGAGSALDNVQQGNVEVTLISELQVVAPGSTVWVALRQNIREGWHTYWRNPGDSGAPTELIWDLPPGFAAGEIQWPFPDRVPYGPLMNYGYHGEVLFPVQVTIPADFNGSEVTLSARAQWLVCADICIPEDANLVIKIPVGEALIDPNLVETFEAVRRKIPQPIGVPTRFFVLPHAEGEVATVNIEIDMPALVPERIKSIDYFPFTEGVMENPAEQLVKIDETGIQMTLTTGWDYGPSSSFEGIIVVTEDAGAEIVNAFSFNPEAVAAAGAKQGEQVNTTVDFNALVQALLFALIGGMILNLMPCVFPVLSIKVLSLVQQTGSKSGSVRLHGWVYTVGVVLSFVAIAGVLLLLRAGGAQIGWGFQLQSPIVITLLVYLFFLIGLSLSGYFEIGGGMMNVGQSLANKEGLSGSFFTGVLAAVVAAPCTAPFMATAIGFALTQPAYVALLIFASLGFGMAIPYLLLCYSPALLRRMPRPGNWMVRFKELLAFPMFATVIWLMWVLGFQVDSTGVTIVMMGLLLITFAVWLLRNADGSPTQRRIVWLAVVMLVAGAIYLPLQSESSAGGAEASAGDTSAKKKGSRSTYVGPEIEKYSAARLAELRKEGPVFINFTAAWCITCQVNEVVALNKLSTAKLFRENDVAYLKGDWTNEDPAITQKLEEYERSGVPLYLLYGPATDDKPATVLPQVLTEAIVADHIWKMSKQI
jgi:thiol:disulfide interchange protein